MFLSVRGFEGMERRSRNGKIKGFDRRNKDIVSVRSCFLKLRVCVCVCVCAASKWCTAFFKGS